jgi:hypothetical protein
VTALALALLGLALLRPLPAAASSLLLPLLLSGLALLRAPLLLAGSLGLALL